MAAELDKFVERAIKVGELPDCYFLDWRDKEKYPISALLEINHGLVMCRWIEAHCKVPEGSKSGEQIRLTASQCAFLVSSFPGNKTTRDSVRVALLSMSKRNGKSLLVAAILLCMLNLSKELGIPPNSTLVSAAATLQQASILFKLSLLMISHNKKVLNRLKISEYHKSIIHKKTGVNYRALSADGNKQHGLTVFCGILDEAQTITASSSSITSFLETSLSSFDNSKLIVISTQAKSDTAYMSQLIDNSIAVDAPNTVIHLYAADPECRIDDEDEWYAANPSLKYGHISIESIRANCRASLMSPAKEMAFRNYVLNGRVSEHAAYIAPAAWAKCGGDIYLGDFRGENTVVNLGIDLSLVRDFSAFVLAAKNPVTGIVSLLPLTFTRSGDLEERERLEKVPYSQLIKDGDLRIAGVDTIRYKEVAQMVKDQLEQWNINVNHVIADGWRLTDFVMAAEDVGLCDSAVWHKCSQGFTHMSARVDSFESAVLDGILNHGDSPILTLAVHHAKVVYNSDGLRKITKSNRLHKVDPLISSMMSAHYLIHDLEIDDGVPLVG